MFLNSEIIQKHEEFIRNHWLSNHKILHHEKHGDLERVFFAEEDVPTFRFEYIKSGDYLFIADTFVSASIHSFQPFTWSDFSDGKLSYEWFMDHVIKGLDEKDYPIWDHEEFEALKQIQHFLCSRAGVDTIEELSEDDQALYEELKQICEFATTRNEFEHHIFYLFHSERFPTFDAEAMFTVAHFGKIINLHLFAYWVGLKMIGEQLEKS